MAPGSARADMAGPLDGQRRRYRDQGRPRLETRAYGMAGRRRPHRAGQHLCQRGSRLRPAPADLRGSHPAEHRVAADHDRSRVAAEMARVRDADGFAGLRAAGSPARQAMSPPSAPWPGSR